MDETVMPDDNLLSPDDDFRFIVNLSHASEPASDSSISFDAGYGYIFNVHVVGSGGAEAAAGRMPPSVAEDVVRCSMAQMCLNIKALPSEYGHTVVLRSVRLGGCGEGECFYDRGVYEPGRRRWGECEDMKRIPADFIPKINEDNLLLMIPKDFSSTGLPIEIEFSIMDGGTVLMNDCLKTRLYPDLRSGTRFEASFDLTPVPITFNPSVDSWDEAAVDQNISFSSAFVYASAP